MQSRRMANQQTKLISQLLGMCLKGTKGKEKFEFFDMNSDTWDKLVPPLQELFPGTEIHQDVITVKKLFNGWITHVAEINDGARLEIDQAARVAPPGLGFNQEGRKAW